MVLRVWPAAVLAVSLAGGAFAADPDPPVTRSDDAFHFASFADGHHDGLYAEWWYFNLIDTEQDLQMILAYSVVDPANRSGLGLASVLAVVYTPGGTVKELAAFPTEAFSGSPDEAHVTVAGGPAGHARIEVEADDRYRLSGVVAGAHHVDWSLDYLREGRPWFAADRRQVGKQPWELMSWLVYMPSASVSGTVTVDGQVHHVHGARGYHDHNWGEWIPGVVTWNWAEYTSPQISVALGDFPRVDEGMVGVDFEGRRTIFDPSQYHIVHTAWTEDPINKRRYPRMTWLRAENDDTSLLLRFEALDTEPIVPPLDLPVRPLIYEQTARVTGVLWVRDADGEWRRRATFGSLGFKEYTSLTAVAPP
jgi:hypothetical protein